MPDGQVYSLTLETPWQLLQPVGKGFITHFDEKESAIWYITPRP
jgi:hypothetical protein